MLFRSRNITVAYRFLVTGSLTAVSLLLILSGSGTTTAQVRKQSETTSAASSNADLIARGKYLVEGVAACADCHTPRDKNGEPDRTRWLSGAPVFLQPAQAVPGWAAVAPRLAGLPPGSDNAVITLLTTGIWTNGKHPRQPMPRFQMTRSDAEGCPRLFEIALTKSIKAASLCRFSCQAVGAFNKYSCHLYDFLISDS